MLRNRSSPATLKRFSVAGAVAGAVEGSAAFIDASHGEKANAAAVDPANRSACRRVSLFEVMTTSAAYPLMVSTLLSKLL